MADPKKPETEPVSLQDEARNAIEEARMVLPGIQAIFGFQLIAIFNQRFDELDSTLQDWHLAALILVAVSMALIMSPAAYDRIAERGQVSRRFIELSSRLIESAMMPLMAAIAIEVFVVTRVVSESGAISVTLALLLLMFFAWWWVVFPYLSRYRRRNRH